jgi:hypothetical protein
MRWARESQRTKSRAWAEDRLPCKRKALFAYGADRAFPIIRVGFLRFGGKEIRKGWEYEGTAGGSGRPALHVSQLADFSEGDDLGYLLNGPHWKKVR